MKKGIKYLSIVTFYFLTREKSKTLILKGKVSQEFYNAYLLKYRATQLNMNVFDIDKSPASVELFERWLCITHLYTQHSHGNQL